MMPYTPHRLPLALVLLALFFCPHRSCADFLYSDFSSVSGLQVNGDAAQSGSLLRLTPAAPSRIGSAFTTSLVPLGNQASFSTLFQFRITNSGGQGDADGIGADGIAFVIHTSSNSLGWQGGFLGLGGNPITPSLGVEFDTFANPEFGDPSGNHVGIDLNGNVASAATANEPTRFNNEGLWNAWIDYNGLVGTLEVRWSQTPVRPVSSQLSSAVNLQSLLGQNSGYVGFTSGTASGWGDHDIVSWEFRDRYDPITVAPVPESTGVLYLITASIGVVAILNRWIRVTGQHARHISPHGA